MCNQVFCFQLSCESCVYVHANYFVFEFKNRSKKVRVLEERDVVNTKKIAELQGYVERGLQENASVNEGLDRGKFKTLFLNIELK